MTTVQPTVYWLESSLQSPPEFRIPFESSQSKTSLLSSSPSAPPWPWPPCWPPCWPRGYWGRPGSGPGPQIYFIVWTFQIGKTAAGTGKWKICLFKTSVVCWAEQDVEALRIFLEKNGRFEVLLFPSSLQYLQCFRSTLKQDYPSHGQESLFYCDLYGLLL